MLAHKSQAPSSCSSRTVVLRLYPPCRPCASATVQLSHQVRFPKTTQHNTAPRPSPAARSDKKRSRRARPPVRFTAGASRCVVGNTDTGRDGAPACCYCARSRKGTITTTSRPLAPQPARGRAGSPGGPAGAVSQPCPCAWAVGASGAAQRDAMLLPVPAGLAASATLPCLRWMMHWHGMVHAGYGDTHDMRRARARRQVGALL